MALKSDAKFEEKLTLGSKNDMRNFVNFNGAVASLKIFTLIYRGVLHMVSKMT